MKIRELKQRVKEWTIPGDTEELDMSYSQIDRIPDRITSLNKLVSLNLSGNQIHKISNKFARECPHVRYLDISGNKLVELPESLGTNLGQSLITLKLSFNQIQIMPDLAISELVNLEVLDLSHNGLSSFSGQVGRLKRLKVLKLSHNSITTLTEHIGSMTSLCELYLDNNQLKNLDVIFGALKRLRVLDLSHNKFQKLPRALRTVDTSLKTLHLAYNEIKELDPVTLQGLGHVHVLDLSDNKLESVPEEMTALGKVQTINLEENPRLLKWPTTVRSMKNIKYDWLHLVTQHSHMEDILYSRQVPAIKVQEKARAVSSPLKSPRRDETEDTIAALEQELNRVPKRPPRRKDRIAQR